MAPGYTGANVGFLTCIALRQDGGVGCSLDSWKSHSDVCRQVPVPIFATRKPTTNARFHLRDVFRITLIPNEINNF
jgi:hypothetical protein